MCSEVLRGVHRPVATSSDGTTRCPHLIVEGTHLSSKAALCLRYGLEGPSRSSYFVRSTSSTPLSSTSKRARPSATVTLAPV